VYHSQAICDFSVIHNGGLLIYGRQAVFETGNDVTNRKSNRGFQLMFSTFQAYCEPLASYMGFLIVKNGGLAISAAGGASCTGSNIAV
jgi:hypothetical protein